MHTMQSFIDEELKLDLRNSRPEAKDPDPAIARITHGGYRSTVSIQHRLLPQDKSGLLTGPNDAIAHLKCFDDRRSLRLWLMIPEISMNKNPEINTHAYMQVWLTFQIWFLAISERSPMLNSDEPFQVIDEFPSLLLPAVMQTLHREYMKTGWSV